ncbi:MAG: ankyrin repeat domain-containing protein [Pseudomonadota bacterium]
MNTRTRTGVQPPSRPWPLLLFFGLAGAAITQEEPVSPPGPPAQRAETVALCEALAGPAPDARRVRVLLAQGADPDTICVVTTTIKVPTEPHPSLLGNLARTLTGGRPSLGKALVGLLMLPLLPVLGLMDGLNRALDPGFRLQTVEAHLPPLHLAAQADASACALVLLEAGAELERQDEDGLTPLAYALVHAEQQGTSETLPLLLERGASLKALEPYDARGLAAIALQPALLSLLCAHGLDPDASPAGRPTALVLAVEDGHEAATRGLLACGASPEPRQRADRVPVDAARRADRPELLDLLVEHGASLETEDEGGRGALTRALDDGATRWVSVLLERGVLLDHPDVSGDTPLHHAMDCADPLPLELLLEAGADPHVENAGGESPLEVALWGYQLDRAALLLDHGAPIDEGLEGWLERTGEEAAEGQHWRPVDLWEAAAVLLLKHGLPPSRALLVPAVTLDRPALVEVLIAHGEDSPARVYRRLARKARRAGASEVLVALLEGEQAARRKRWWGR